MSPVGIDASDLEVSLESVAPFFSCKHKESESAPVQNVSKMVTSYWLSCRDDVFVLSKRKKR